MPDPLEDLADLAADLHVAVVGGGVAGLVAALECAKVGLRVTVVEASDRVGGVVQSAELAGQSVELAADRFATRGDALVTLLEELDLTDAIRPRDADRTWVAGIPGGAAPVPRDTVLGIPANPWAADVRRVIGWGGAWRAYLDRLRPPLTIGHERSLGALVERRMGVEVRDRMVAPLSLGMHGIAPEEVDVDLAAPGLNAALTRTGSLSGAVTQLRQERSGHGSALARIDGGMPRLVAALVHRLQDLGVEVRTTASIRAIEPRGAGWTVRTSADADPLAADAVILAAPEGTARALLAPLLGDAIPAADPLVWDVVTLVARASALDAAPRGDRVVAAAGTSDATCLELRQLGSGLHALRVSAAPRAAAEPAALDVPRARAAASALSGVPVLDTVASHVASYEWAPPRTALGRTDEVDRVRLAVSGRKGLGVVGGWIAGAGLAQVIPDAAAEADRVRRAVLWGAPRT